MPEGPLTSKPMWWNTFGYSTTSAFFVLVGPHGPGLIREGFIMSSEWYLAVCLHCGRPWPAIACAPGVCPKCYGEGHQGSSAGSCCVCQEQLNGREARIKAALARTERRVVGPGPGLIADEV